MEDGLGELGFWVFLGLIVAAGTVSEAIKEGGKERDKQATLRALLEKEGDGVREVLAYLRERDAAEAAEAARARARSTEDMRRLGRWLKAAIGIVAFPLGIYAFAAVRFGIMRSSGSILIPLLAMFTIWGLGLLIARPAWLFAKQKNDAHPEA